jgi:hypothetical protein
LTTNVTRGADIMGDRYKYDFRNCTSANGWAQLDTRQDASYYGNWVNPTERKLFSYCEGDTTLTECDNDADFIAAVRESIRWHAEREYFIGIDGMCNEQIIAAFTKLGLAEFLH